MSVSKGTLFASHFFVKTAWQHVAFASQLAYVLQKLNSRRVTNFRNKHSNPLLRKLPTSAMCVDEIILLVAIKIWWNCPG